MRQTLLLILLFVAVSSPFFGEDSYPIKVYPCPRFAAPPKIDGVLSDRCWAQAPVVSGFTWYNKPKLLKVPTSFRVGYDGKCLYFGVHSDEPNVKRLTPSFAGRDSHGVFRGETIEVFLDPLHSHSDYYQFAVNLAGSFYDSLKFDAHWNSTTRLKTKIVADGWELEMAVSWREIGVKAPKPGMVVGFNVCRDRYAGGSREWSNWSQTMANFHDVARFAHLVLSPTEAMLGKLGTEFRKGDRRGPILVFGPQGYSGRAYLAMARQALRRLEQQLAALEAEAEKEIALGPSEEVARCLGAAKVMVEPYRARIAEAKALDGAEWTRMSVGMTKAEARLRTLIWEARLAALLKGI